MTVVVNLDVLYRSLGRKDVDWSEVYSSEIPRLTLRNYIKKAENKRYESGSGDVETAVYEALSGVLPESSLHDDTLDECVELVKIEMGSGRLEEYQKKFIRVVNPPKPQEPLKRKKQYVILPDALYFALKIEGCEPDPAIDDAIERLRENKRPTTAYSESHAYNNFLNNAGIPSWEQEKMKDLLRKYRDVCIVEGKTGMLPDSMRMLNRMAEHMSKQPMNILEGETPKQRKDRMMDYLKTEFTTKGGIRRGKLSKRYLGIEKEMSGKEKPATDSENPYPQQLDLF